MVVLLILLLASTLGPASSQDCAYSNELVGYRLCETAAWRSLRPLVSTLADVRAILGTPTYEWDMTNYHVPYPGDKAAKEPILGFDDGGPWRIQVRLVRTDEDARSLYPASLRDRLLSIFLIPTQRVPFGQVVFPRSFVKRHVVDGDLAWDEYHHPSGLTYQVYSAHAPYADYQAGDLTGITYGVSDEAKRAHRGDRSN